MKPLEPWKVTPHSHSENAPIFSGVRESRDIYLIAHIGKHLRDDHNIDLFDDGDMGIDVGVHEVGNVVIELAKFHRANHGVFEMPKVQEPA